MAPLECAMFIIMISRHLKSVLIIEFQKNTEITEHINITMKRGSNTRLPFWTHTLQWQAGREHGPPPACEARGRLLLSHLLAYLQAKVWDDSTCSNFNSLSNPNLCLLLFIGRLTIYLVILVTLLSLSSTAIIQLVTCLSSPTLNRG